MSLIKIKEVETIAVWRCLSDNERTCYSYVVIKDIPKELIGRYVIASIYYRHRLIMRSIVRVWRCGDSGCVGVEDLEEWLANKNVKVVISRPKKSYWWFP